MSDMLNEEQRGHLRYLASLPREQKCDCGWAKRGECYGRCYGKPEQGGAICTHEWREEYYGTRCARCRLFYPHGCAPWDAVAD